jgi:hypothetical protein
MSNLIPINEVKEMAKAVATSKLFGVKDEMGALALLLLAQAEGLHPMIAARDYDIINGRPAKKYEAMHRSFLSSNGKIEWHKLDDTVADATFSHPQGGEVRITWDIDRAIKAGVTGNPTWKKYPRAMLRSRCISEGVRTIYPEATSGMYEVEEARDIPKDITPKQTVIVNKEPIDKDAILIKVTEKINKQFEKITNVTDLKTPEYQKWEKDVLDFAKQKNILNEVQEILMEHLSIASQKTIISTDTDDKIPY